MFLLAFIIFPSSLNAQTIFLINPSEECKSHLKSSFKKFLSIKENLYQMEVLVNDERVSKITKYKDLEFAYTIQGIDARLIITKEKKSKTGSLIFLDEKFTYSITK